MRIALIQLRYDDAAPLPERRARAADLVRAQRGHDLVVLPELWAPGGFDYRVSGAHHYVAIHDIVLADGELLYIGTPDELAGDRDLETAFLELCAGS